MRAVLQVICGYLQLFSYSVVREPNNDSSAQSLGYLQLFSWFSYKELYYSLFVDINNYLVYILFI